MVSKCELPTAAEVCDRLATSLGHEVLAASAVTGQGLDRLTAEIGVSVVGESFDDGESETDAKLRIGQAWERELGAGTSLRQSLSLLSAVDEPEDLTAELVVALAYRLTDRLSLVSKVVNTYDSRPAAGTKRNDLTFATQLGFSFGD